MIVCKSGSSAVFMVCDKYNFYLLYLFVSCFCGSGTSISDASATQSCSSTIKLLAAPILERLRVFLCHTQLDSSSKVGPTVG
ncbi:hypothetical protein GYMLUDRAFT_640602 [Collybiopsis luxurians FD-317 M1]|nr:hypothetical protein GYMLUDRAFT_640602 [Collybiopsis luxurians FD-317 M1]